MAYDPDEDDEVDGDMTPMIDIIFLLLIFFILTTKFIPEEKVIASILPTNKGQAAAPMDKVEPPQDVNVLVYPRGMARGQGQPSYYDKTWKDKGHEGFATLRVGNSDDVYYMSSQILSQRATAQLESHVAEIHGYLELKLGAFETGEQNRSKMNDIVVHCFSGLPWMYALVVYDGIRAYEAKVTGKKEITPEDMQNARNVAFAPPRLRGYHAWELGNELFEIIHMK